MLICTGDRSLVEKTIFADGLNGFGYEKGYKKLFRSVEFSELAIEVFENRIASKTTKVPEAFS